MPETNNLILRHPVLSDWRGMYENVWMHEQTARYMLWDVTRSETEAIDRMERSIRFQKSHETCWFVYEKTSCLPIGFAGMCEISPGVYEDTGIALGPSFTGRGYGKQLLNALIQEARKANAARFIASCRSQNAPSRGMILACGLTYTHTEQRVDPRNDEPYLLEFYAIDL